MLPDPLEPDVPFPPDTSQNKSWFARVGRMLIGKPRDLGDRRLFHHLSLIPFLAWVGLGADGLSSSSYGPAEAFKTLGQHTYLAVALAAMMAATVLIISSAYSRIIEQFPHGGGGYVVATKLLGERIGVVSGCALLVDYMLTITISIAAAGDALFSLLPPAWQPLKLPVEIFFVAGLTTLNIRGVRESVLALTPIFILFLITHVVLIGGGIIGHTGEMAATARSVGTGFRGGMSTLGIGGMLLVFVHAYSLGGGTYTGIEAVSNGLPIMREPRVQTAKRTMLYMSLSLAFTASGLLLCYLLWQVPTNDPELLNIKTLNAILSERLTQSIPLGHLFVILTLLSEGALLVVAAQAGFLDGPRVLANMAVDSWMPRRFAALSDRLTTQNGIVLMGICSLAALLYTGGVVGHIVVMYSINVFLTFSLSMFGMLLFWSRSRATQPLWLRRTALFGTGFVLCATILIITVHEKFLEGGWITLLVTGSFVALCFLIRRHYRTLAARFVELDKDLSLIERMPMPATTPASGRPDPEKPTAVVLVGSYSGLGIHTILQIYRAFPSHFKNFLFVSIAVIDSGAFKGEDEIDALKADTEAMLEKYVQLAHRLGFPAAARMVIGTEVVSEAEKLCLEISKELSQCVFFTGQVIFRYESWYHRFLHNQTAFAIQKRLQWQGMTMVILPIRVRS